MIDASTRLRLAREAAGFATAAEAAERFGWTYATYVSHENGSRGIRASMIPAYARAFKVSGAWLLDGSSPRQAPDAPPEPARPLAGHGGFSEPAMAEYTPATPIEGRAIEAMVASLAPGWRHRVIWRAGRSWHPYAVLKGDLVVIGTPPHAAPDDLVLATWSDPDDVTTLCQRSSGGDGVTLPPGEDRPLSDPAILGTVALVIRPPRLPA